jgi:hypothetical protein
MMSIEEFIDKYGVDSTTNFQLIKWSKDLGIPNFHYVMRDEIKSLSKYKKRPIFIIANYHTSEQKGIHHVALYKSKDISYYFDSYGIILFKEAEVFLENGIYSTFKIQKDNTGLCGQLSLFILYKLSKGLDFFDIVLELNTFFNS